MSTVIIQPSELPINIEAAEKMYNASFVGDFCLQNKDGSWSLETAAVFYQPTPAKPEYSNYFGLFVRNNHIYITDASSVTESNIIGIKADDGEIIYSTNRHDYRTSKDGSVFIDGGRDYTKCSDATKLVTLKIIDDKLVVINT